MTDMPTSDTATLFMQGDAQAVRLPDAFQLPGTKVRVRRVGRGLLLEPVETDAKADLDGWMTALATLKDGPFMPGGREQPAMPAGPVDFDA